MTTPNASNDHELFQPSPEESSIPSGVDRRTFIVRNACIGAAAVMTGTTWTPEAAPLRRRRKPGRQSWGPFSPPTWRS